MLAPRNTNDICSSSRLSTSAPHLTLQQQSQRQAAVAAVTAAPPVPRQADPPPHRFGVPQICKQSHVAMLSGCRSFHQGSDTSSHRLLLVPSGAGSRVAFSPADPSQAALANAPAPLIVSTRGTRPVVRGRGNGCGCTFTRGRRSRVTFIKWVQPNQTTKKEKRIERNNFGQNTRKDNPKSFIVPPASTDGQLF